MSRRSRRRSRSRSRRSDSWRRSTDRSSYDSYSRSRSFTRSRRGSRDRRSISRSHRRNTEPKSNSTFNRDRKRQLEGHPSVPPRVKQNKPEVTTPTHAKSHRPFTNYRGKRQANHSSAWNHSNKYESEEFRSKRLKKAEEYNQQKNAFNLEKVKSKTKLADLTTQLNNLVAQLSLLSKDAPERAELMEKINDIKNSMKSVQMSATLSPNKLDHRATKLLFKELPECAKGPGKLAEWISKNATILLPKQIAMLALSGEGAVIEYHSRKTAEIVMNSCKLHGIEAAWAPVDMVSATSERPKPNEDEVNYNLL